MGTTTTATAFGLHFRELCCDIKGTYVWSNGTVNSSIFWSFVDGLWIGWTRSIQQEKFNGGNCLYLHLENHSQIKEDHEEASVAFQRLLGPWKSHWDIEECLDWTWSPLGSPISSANSTGTIEVREPIKEEPQVSVDEQGLGKGRPFGARSWTSDSSRLVIRWGQLIIRHS